MTTLRGNTVTKRRYRVGLVVVALTAIGAGLAVATFAGLLDRVPLLNPAVAGTVEAAAGAALLGSWLRREPRWSRRGLPALLLAVAAVTGALAVVLRLTGTITDPYPLRLTVWVGMGLAALAGVPVTLRRPGRRQRVAALLAVPLTVTGAFLLIDQEYGVWPQLGDLLGHDNPVISAASQSRMRAASNAKLFGRGGVLGGLTQRTGKGVFVAFDVPASRSHFAHRSGEVYLPPAYFTPARANLPVLIMLAGTPGTPAHWIKAGGAQATIEAYAAANRGMAPVLVFVDQNGGATRDTECVDGPQGKAETYLTADVPAYVTRTLRVTRDPAKWGIVGFSEGGTCALDLTLGHPDRFRHAVDLAGDATPNLGDPEHSRDALFGGSATEQRHHDPRYLMTIRRYPGVTVWLAAGTSDRRRLRVVRLLGKIATGSGIPTHEVTVPGKHNWQFAKATFARVLPQLGGELGLSNVS